MRARFAVLALTFAVAAAGCADADSGDTDFGVSRSTTTSDGERSETTAAERSTTSAAAGSQRSTSTTARAGRTTTTTRAGGGTTTTAQPPATTTTRPAPPATQPPRSATITINNHQFVPAQLAVPLNSEVTVVNQDGVDHSWVGDTGRWHSSNLAAHGGSFTQLFNDRGHFSYHCDYHPNMRGTITVT